MEDGRGDGRGGECEGAAESKMKSLVSCPGKINGMGDYKKC